MNSNRLLFVPALLIASFAFGQGGSRATLKIGDPAPPLNVTWIKGEPFTEFKKGQSYLVEFWATWCNPCKLIMPHLSTLAKKYEKDITVVSVSVGEREPNSNLPGVNRLIKSMGDIFDYRIAADIDDKVNKQWYEASNPTFFPWAVLIGKDGNVAWIGCPAVSDMDLILGLEKSGKLNAETIAAEKKANEAQTQEINAVKAQAETLAKTDYPGAVKLLDALLAKIEDGTLNKYNLMSAKCALAFQNASPEEAKKVTDEFIETYAKNPAALLYFAFSAADRKGNGPAIALKAAETGYAYCDPMNKDFLGLIINNSEKTGDYAKAAKYQAVLITTMDPSKEAAKIATAKQKLEGLEAKAMGKE